MVGPQPTTYTPQFQAQTWRDHVDLASAGAPNGFNAQFRALQAEFNVLKGVVQQLNTAISGLAQAQDGIRELIASANTTADAANNTVNTANNTVNTANSTIGTANSTITQAMQIATNQPPPAWLTVTVNHKGDYTARCVVSYDDLLGQRQNLASGNLYQGITWSPKVPGGAKNVHIHCEEDTGLVDQPVKTILEQDLPTPLTPPVMKTISTWGTITGPGSNA